MTPAPLLDAYEALGTAWWISVDFPQKADPTQASLREEVVTCITNFEKTFSRFLPDSAVTKLNQHRHLADAPVMLTDMLTMGMSYEEATNGLFSLTVGGYLQNAGYGRNTAHVEKKQHSVTATPHLPLSQQLRIDGSTVQLSGDTMIDLGGIGKSYLIDRLADLLQQQGCTQYSINGGGDIAVKLADPLMIEVEHPTKPNMSIASIPLACGALCTSSPFKRQWKNNSGVCVQHLVDPRTGTMDAQHFTESATVVANNVIDADVLATVCALLGSTQWDRIESLLRQYGAQALLCDQDNQVTCSKGLMTTLH